MIAITNAIYKIPPSVNPPRDAWKQLDATGRAALTWVLDSLNSIQRKAAPYPDLVEDVQFLSDLATTFLDYLSPDTEVWVANVSRQREGKVDAKQVFAVGQRYQADADRELDLSELVQEGIYGVFEDGPPDAFDEDAVNDFVRQRLIEGRLARAAGDGQLLFDALAERWEYAEFVIPIVEGWSKEWREQNEAPTQA